MNACYDVLSAGYPLHIAWKAYGPVDGLTRMISALWQVLSPEIRGSVTLFGDSEIRHKISTGILGIKFRPDLHRFTARKFHPPFLFDNFPKELLPETKKVSFSIASWEKRIFPYFMNQCISLLMIDLVILAQFTVSHPEVVYLKTIDIYVLP